MTASMKLSTWPLLDTAQLKAWDQFTIDTEPIASIALMERASCAFVEQLVKDYPDPDQEVIVVCGPGNNGGDGLAIARILHQRHSKNVTVWLNFNKRTLSPETSENLERLQSISGISIIEPVEEFPAIANGCLVVDAMFGTGLNRSLAGTDLKVVVYLNELSVARVSVDVPSGMTLNGMPGGAVFRAEKTYTFQCPKLPFLLNGAGQYAGQWKVLEIGLHDAYLSTLEVPLAVRGVSLKPRARFSHKGTYGHALIVAGSKGKLGAAILATRAALRSGAGLVTVRVPGCGYEVLQSAAPEAMVETDPGHDWHTLPGTVDGYQAIGIGPGLGQASGTVQMLTELLQQAAAIPVVMDADALNILAANPQLWPLVPEGTVLTPHPKEFERLFGSSKDAYERSVLASDMAKDKKVFIVLKDAYTQIACPDGRVYYSMSGNPGMATGGSGDVLTGLLAGLIAQHGRSNEVIAAGVWIHGRAGDLAMQQYSAPSMLAGDVIAHIGMVYQEITDSNC